MIGATVNGHLNRDALIESLLDPLSYAHAVSGPVVLHETHISWVLLAGDFAYKIKKPIATEFLDYSSVSKRHHACCEELRLGSRYAVGLYLDVVPITMQDGLIRMDGDTQPIEFAVRMRRFDEDVLLSHRLKTNSLGRQDMIQLATTIASFHAAASRLEPTPKDIVPKILDQAQQNFKCLFMEPLLRQDPTVQELESWTSNQSENHRQCFINRARNGFIRECHGDLHCGNIVFWRNQWVPFDGIEFNSEFSWIDVISDIAFLVMDLQELGHSELSSALLNAYLEQTGDYQALEVLSWYLVYRALVRAKVAVMRERQLNEVQRLNMEQIALAKAYIGLADRLTKLGTRKLWITHGLSGSGKTTGSQQIVEREGAIRIRSDVERKRIFSTVASQSKNHFGDGMYSASASEATYQRLHEVARGILQSDFNVIVDATFLRSVDRQRFYSLAKSERAEFRILDFQVDEATLKQRIEHRRLTSSDASDATLETLANQLLSQDPLSADELKLTISETNH